MTTPVTRDPQPYHVGYVVEDLEDALARSTALSGVRWAPVRDLGVAVSVDGDIRDVHLRVSYSIDGPPHTEMIEELGGDIWSPHALRLDHVGYYCDDLAAAMERCTELGWRVRVHDVANDGRPAVFAYVQQPSGSWVELVDVGFEHQLRAWLVE